MALPPSSTISSPHSPTVELPGSLTIATVCARGGSKGIPGKNIRLFPDANGLPLIVHTIRQAMACSRIDKTYVSTDDAGIAEIAHRAGAIVPYLRPENLAADTSAKVPAIEHLVAFLEAQGERIGYVVDLQPTSPLRAPGDIESCLDAMDEVDLALSVYDAGFHPAFNLVETVSGGMVRPCSVVGAARRQDLAPVWALNGSIYCWRRGALALAAQKGLWSVKVRGVPMPRERSADIDDMLDWEWAAWLYRRQTESFGA